MIVAVALVAVFVAVPLLIARGLATLGYDDVDYDTHCPCCDTDDTVEDDDGWSLCLQCRTSFRERQRTSVPPTISTSRCAKPSASTR